MLLIRGYIFFVHLSVVCWEFIFFLFTYVVVGSVFFFVLLVVVGGVSNIFVIFCCCLGVCFFSRVRCWEVFSTCVPFITFVDLLARFFFFRYRLSLSKRRYFLSIFISLGLIVVWGSFPVFYSSSLCVVLGFWFCFVVVGWADIHLVLFLVFVWLGDILCLLYLCWYRLCGVLFLLLFLKFCMLADLFFILLALVAWGIFFFYFQLFVVEGFGFIYDFRLLFGVLLLYKYL